MAAMFKVQKGVPLPGINRNPARRKYPVRSMEVGDMFFYPGSDTKTISAYISRITRDLPGKFSARHCWMRQDSDGAWSLTDEGSAGATEGTGVWRLE